jgi:hypothetical protein
LGEIPLDKCSLDIVKAPENRRHHPADHLKLPEIKRPDLAPSIIRILKAQKVPQMEWMLAVGPAWNNPLDLVFTDERGGHLKHRTIINHFKKIVASIGLENTRFQDLRHSCAVNALQAGDSVKAVQEQLGHCSCAFTMDVYAAVSNTMRRASTVADGGPVQGGFGPVRGKVWGQIRIAAFNAKHISSISKESKGKPCDFTTITGFSDGGATTTNGEHPAWLETALSKCSSILSRRMSSMVICLSPPLRISVILSS